MRRLLLAAGCAAALTAPAMADTFRFAYQADPQGLDPHALNETFTLGFLGNIYEGLTAYDADMNLVPSLATEWAATGPTTWAVKLREGVTFHDGATFEAEDVVFSWERGLSEGSDQKARAGLIKAITVKGPYEIEIETVAPTPTLMRELTVYYIMDKGWAEANDAVTATSVADANSANFANLNENGTGPYTITARQSGVETRLAAFDGYWGDTPGAAEVIFTPIAEDPTRVAALLSGQIDLAYPVPTQDWQRIDAAEGVKVMSGAEARTIFLGFDQFRDVLTHASIEGPNPFRDIRVRQAFAHAIDVNAIVAKVMRGAATPAGLLVAPQVNGFDQSLNQPYVYDPEKAQALLAEAGYPDGFTVQMDCPNDRYVNDEQICQAAAGFLSKIGITVDLLAQTRSKYFAKVLAAGGYDTSFHLFAWTPGSMDAHNVLSLLMSCRDEAGKPAQFNLGGYCNPRVDKLTAAIAGEADKAKRQAMISEAFRIAKDDYAYIPLHQQPLSWGVAEGVTVAQRADNVLDLRSVSLP